MIDIFAEFVGSFSKDIRPLSNFDILYISIPRLHYSGHQNQIETQNKLLRKGQLEKADALSRRIGLEIAKKNSTMAKSLGPSTTSRELWSVVRKLRNRSNNEVRDVAGVDAEALNRHYARISYDSNYIEPRLKHTVNSNSEKQITEYEVFKILDALKKTATGIDKLPAWFLRLGAPVFAKRVTSLFNSSLREGVVPGQWRRAYIHPIAKTSAPVAPVDYRPISITPVLSRILEKLVVRNFIYPTLPTAPPLCRSRISLPLGRPDLQQLLSSPSYKRSRHCCSLIHSWWSSCWTIARRLIH